MPLRFTVTSGAEGEMMFPPARIEPGRVTGCDNFLSGVRRVIAVVCNERDDGGQVFEFDYAGFPEGETDAASGVGWMTIDQSCLNIDTLIGTVGSRGRFEREVMDEELEIGRLVVEHVIEN